MLDNACTLLSVVLLPLGILVAIVLDLRERAKSREPEKRGFDVIMKTSPIPPKPLAEAVGDAADPSAN